MSSLDTAESLLERFRHRIEAKLGLDFSDDRGEPLGEILHRRAEAASLSTEAYLLHLESAASPGEWSALASELTIGETYFFRHADQFRALADVALAPQLARRGAPLRVLSAGCSSGEEAYTIAILLRELAPGLRFSERPVLGVDLNPRALARAREARYPAWSFREMPPETRERWFQPHGKTHALHDSIRELVTFEERNLAEPDPLLFEPGRYAAIFCRNVSMYFSVEATRALVSRLARALAPGGHLFLGHAETLRDLSTEFHLRHTHGAFYYQRKDELPAVPPSPAPVVAPPVEVGSWIEAIEGATARIEALSRAAPAARPSAPVESGNRESMQSAFELLRDERYHDALQLLDRLPKDQAQAPESLLLRAVVLCQRGAFIEAERCCRELLALDDFHAGAHHVLALCCEGRGDRASALEHDHLASYLDPGFAMPRLHAGLVARRSGSPAEAQRELEHALRLLQREDPSRLVLYGGGFGRASLVALAQAELDACRGLR